MSKDFLRVREVSEMLAELKGAISAHDELELTKAGTTQVVDRLNVMLDKYLTSLYGLNLDVKPVGCGNEDDAKDRKDLSRVKLSMELIEGLVDVIGQQAKLNNTNKNVMYHSTMAFKREGLFSPKQMYQLKEDFEAVSLLHSRHKAETERLIEEGSIAATRNAELRLSLEDIKSDIVCKDKLIAELQAKLELKVS